MKRGLILLIAVLGSTHLGCRQQGPTEVQADPPAGVNGARTPEDGSAIIRTEKGTVIKKSGWQLPILLPKDKQYHATTVIVEGRHVEVLNSPLIPEEKPLVRMPNLVQDGEAEYEINQIIEFTDSRRRPYCYQLFASPQHPESVNTQPVAPTFFSYLDDDGDGIFETLEATCRVPDWVK